MGQLKGILAIPPSPWTGEGEGGGDKVEELRTRVTDTLARRSAPARRQGHAFLGAEEGRRGKSKHLNQRDLPLRRSTHS